MARYAIWDKASDIYTLGTDTEGRNHYTAAEYISKKAPWAANSAVKVIVGGGAINGTCFMEYDATKEFYAKQGADFSACITDAEVLAKIEDFEDHPPVSDTPSAEERIAAALEYQTIASMPDATTTTTASNG